MSYTSVKEMNDFFQDKRKLKDHIERLECDKKFYPNSVNELLATESRWKKYPPLYRSMKDDFTRLKDLLIEDSKKIYPEKPKNMEQLMKMREKIQTNPLEEIVIESKESRQQKNDEACNQILQKMQSSFQKTPALIHAFYDSQGLVGEYENRELLIYGALSRTNMGIESIAGSGKSALLYAFLKAIPEKEYSTIHQSTGKAFYNNPAINNARIWVIPELQKIFSQDAEEIIKNLTEGVSITHTRTNKNRDGVDTFEITPKTIFYSFAITNKHLKYRDDEFYRRFVILHTDIRKEQNNNVAKHYAQTDFSSSEQSNTPKRLLEHHLKICFASEAIVKNPFLESIIESFPQEIKGHVRFRSSVKYLQSLTKGKTLYEQSTLNQEPFLFSSLSDAVDILSLYQHTLIMNLHGINSIEAGLLQVLEKNPEGSTFEEVQKKFREEYLASFPCSEIIEKLTDQELIKKEKDRFFVIPFPKSSFSPENLLEKASTLMKKEYPKEHDRWYELSLKNLTSTGDKRL